MDNHNDKSAAGVPEDITPPNKVSLDDTDVELTDYPAFEDADACPECDAPRPFGQTCPNCGYTTPSPNRGRSDPTGAANSTAHNVTLDRVVITVVTARNEASAKAKARATLQQYDLTPAKSSPLMTVRLIDELDDEVTFPNKWGELPGIVTADSPAGDDLLSTAADNARLDTSDDVEPAIIDESGTPVHDRDRLNEVLAGEAAPIAPTDDTAVWLIPALAFTGKADEQPNRTRTRHSETRSPKDVHHPDHTVKAAELEQFTEVMEALEKTGGLPEF